jgi:hypothetical protein
MVSIHRQPYYPGWASQNIAGCAYGLWWPSVDTVATGDAVDIPVSPMWWNSGARSGGTVDPGVNFAVTGTRSDPFYPIVGVDEEGTRPFIWCHSFGYTVAVLNTNWTAGTITAIAALERWVGPGLVSTSTTTVAMNITGNGLSAANIAVQPGWWRLRSLTIASGASATTGNISAIGLFAQNQGPVVVLSPPGMTFATGASNSLMPLGTTSEFDVTPVPWQDTKVTAAALLLSNVTRALEKEGTVLWARVNPEQYDPFTVPKTVINSMHPAERSLLAAELGTYTYTMPSTDLATFRSFVLQFATTSGVGAGNTAIPVYRLDSKSMVNVGYVTDPALPTSNFAFTLDFHVEFRTTSTIFELGMSRLPMEALHQAQLELLEMGFFFSNESHWSVIPRAIKAMAKYTAPLSMMGPYGKAAAFAIKAADIVVRTRSKPPPASTLRLAGQSVVSSRTEGSARLPSFKYPGPKMSKKKLKSLQKRTIDRQLLKTTVRAPRRR